MNINKVEFKCTDCLHKNVCMYIVDMKNLDDQLTSCETTSPFVRIGVTCDQYQGSLCLQSKSQK